MYTIKFKHLPKIIAGVINHRTEEIIINTRNSTTRQEVALTHELLHLYERFAKEKFDHMTLHRLSVFIVSEIFPKIKEIRKVRKSKV